MNCFFRLGKRVCFLLVLASFFFTSCATVLGGKVDTCQRTKPKDGQESRKVRAGYLIADALFGFMPLIIDFATGSIYKPCPEQKPTSAVIPFLPPATTTPPTTSEK